MCCLFIGIANDVQPLLDRVRVKGQLIDLKTGLRDRPQFTGLLAELPPERRN